MLLNRQWLTASLLMILGCTVVPKPFEAEGRATPAPTAQMPYLAGHRYGLDSDLNATVSAVRSGGQIRMLSSQALRLPAIPLGPITAFFYRFPLECGGHIFRVYETGETQILEFDYESRLGRRYEIRDYLTGPTAFSAPGLWTAYDHTADSLDEMRFQFDDRGNGILVGTYSQGPFTGLDPETRVTLGSEYERALHAAGSCFRDQS